MKMICANPDIVIHRGDTLIYCAGALARRYEDLGGLVIYAGKPHPPIYDSALALAERVRGEPIDKRRVLAIGDGMRTDILGATRAGLDALFVTGGIHRSLHKETLELPADPIELRRLYDESEAWRSPPSRRFGRRRRGGFYCPPSRANRWRRHARSGFHGSGLGRACKIRCLDALFRRSCGRHAGDNSQDGRK